MADLATVWEWGSLTVVIVSFVPNFCINTFDAERPRILTLKYRLF